MQIFNFHSFLFLGNMDDFAEAVLLLQTFEKSKNETNWKEIQKILNSYSVIQNYEEENEVIKQLCNDIFDEEFLKIIKNVDKYREAAKLEVNVLEKIQEKDPTATQ